MNIKTTIILLALIALSTGCGTMKVTSELVDDYDYAKFKTYHWVDAPADILNQEDLYINDDIQRVLDAEFLKLGFQQGSDTSVTDLQLVHYVKLREQIEYTDSANQNERDFSGGFVYSRDKNWSYAEREPDINLYAVEIGTLTILAYDAKTGERIWKGTLKTKIDRSQSQETQKELIQIAVEKLMDKFPSKNK